MPNFLTVKLTLQTPQATLHSSLVADAWFAWHSMHRSIIWFLHIAQLSTTISEKIVFLMLIKGDIFEKIHIEIFLCIIHKNQITSKLLFVKYKNGWKKYYSTKFKFINYPMPIRLLHSTETKKMISWFVEEVIKDFLNVNIPFWLQNVSFLL